MINKIKAIDEKIAQLYVERMNLAITTKENADLKATLNSVTSDMTDQLKLYSKQLFSTIFDTASAYKNTIDTKSSPTVQKIKDALSNTKSFPINGIVACQGLEGSYSSIATERLFQLSEIMYFRNFESVFNAVEKGFCQYGILPIENSTAGSVNSVYDLMKEHKFYIVKSIKMRIQHHLLAKKGVDFSDIKEIISHEQALSQCSILLKNHPNIKVTILENTAVAAKMVADSDRKDIACISSRECASVYDLAVIKSNIQDNENNFTRFICIAKDLAIYEDSDKISLMLTAPHVSGSLTKIINKFSTLSLNLTKLESRPLQNTSFEFMFYFDFMAKVSKQEILNLIAELENTTEQFSFLGSYQEIF